ncbi:MAG: phage tail assembly protein [Alphaproteobacteria bacterium HGW-Alphaproteobacteria-16]|nr:MAG: phage tail assembly protein [Alphaproteobacteria bacterium HGW-Alphaproteobacteria-16]
MTDENPNTGNDAGRFATVTLATPIQRGETKIAELTLRKPRAGELRGLALQDVIQTDVSAMLKLIPRVSTPPLTQDEADNLEADDLTEIAGAIRGFFMTGAEKQLLEAMMAEHQPTA